MTADFVADRMLELLTAAEVSLTLARTGNPVPTRTGRTHGAPVAEVCEGSAYGGQLNVYVDNPAITVEAQAQGRTHNIGARLWMPYLNLVVELWRCAPKVGPVLPSAADLDAYAAAMAKDGFALVTGLEQAKIGGTLFASIPPNLEVRLGQLLPLPIQGGSGGWKMTVQVPVNDAGPAI